MANGDITFLALVGVAFAGFGITLFVLSSRGS